MAETEKDYVELGKVCCGDLEEVRDDGLGIHDYADNDGFIFGDTTSGRVDANLFR